MYGAPSRIRTHHLFFIHLVTQSCKPFHKVSLFFTIRSLDMTQSDMYGALINYRSHYSVEINRERPTFSTLQVNA